MTSVSKRLAPALFAVPLSFLLVSVAHAQGTVPVDGLGFFLLQIIYFIDRYLVPIIFALAFLVFLWGVYSTFIAGANNEEKRQEGQKLVMYGLIGFFVMLSVWGIVNLLIHSFGFGAGSRPSLPTFGAPGGYASDPTSPTQDLQSVDVPEAFHPDNNVELQTMPNYHVDSQTSAP